MVAEAIPGRLLCGAAAPRKLHIAHMPSLVNEANR
jgi:hypothetical protein